MTGLELTNRLLTRLGDNPASPKYFRQADALAAIREAQELFVLLTLCLEAETPIAISPGVFEYDAMAARADWLVCLSLTRGVDGKKVRPSTLGEVAAKNSQWQATADVGPERYAVAGFSKLFVTPQPVALGTLTAVYARGPVTLTLGGSAEIPEERQPCLLDYAQVRLRMSQGAQLLAADLSLLKSFFAEVEAAAAMVRERSKDRRYDVLPAEVRMPDWSRMEKQMRGSLDRKHGDAA